MYTWPDTDANTDPDTNAAYTSDPKYTHAQAAFASDAYIHTHAHTTMYTNTGTHTDPDTVATSCVSAKCIPVTNCRPPPLSLAAR